MANVKFLAVKLKETYEALETKDALALYWIDETQELYKGEKLFGTGAMATAQAAGLLSAEDKAKLDALAASGGGLSNLIPVDGTIKIADTADGGKSIGIAVSTQEGNALVAVADGLFVPTAEKVSVPEYVIERQAAAEDGYAASYKLKKTLGGVSEYVGDTINIAKDMVLKTATLETVVEADVPYAGAVVGDPYIKMAFNDATASVIYVPMKGLVDSYTAGTGIEIVDNKISVKLAADAHGLVAVDGALSIKLATKTSDGAMSKADKAALDAIPSVYVARKYEITDLPTGSLVDYGNKEIRVMCPADAQFVKQSVGAGGNTNAYYMTFKTYAPNDNAVGYIEHIGDNSDSEILTKFSTDAYGRRYQSTWLAVAQYDEATGTWTYLGEKSSEGKYIGWDYRIDWYDANGLMIASDNVRINLSNENCHYTTKPFYMAEYATVVEVDEISSKVDTLVTSMSWSEL
jgi:hypothetical protein